MNNCLIFEKVLFKVIIIKYTHAVNVYFLSIKVLRIRVITLCLIVIVALCILNSGPDSKTKKAKTMKTNKCSKKVNNNNFKSF